MEELILIISTLGNIILGFLVFIKNKKSWTHRFFFILCLALGAWLVSNYYSLNVGTKETFLFWVRVVMGLAVVQAISFFLFVRVFPFAQLSIQKRYLFVIILLGCFTIILCLSPLLFIDAEITASGYSPKPGPGFIIFIPVAVGALVLGLIKLVRKQRTSFGLEKKRITFLLAGVGLMFGFILLFNFLLVVVFHLSDFVILSPLFTLIFVSLTTYSILKHRLLDIRLFITRSILYFFLVLFVTASFALMTYLTGQVFGTATGTNPMVITIFVSLIIVLLIDPLKRWIAKATEAVFFKKSINYPQVSQDLSEIASVELDLTRLITQMTKATADRMKLRGATILLSTERNSFSPIHAPKINHITHTLRLNDPFIPFLRNAHQTLVLDELDRKVADARSPRERNRLEKVRNTMEHLKAEAAVPVILERQLKAIILLDRKLSGDVFSQNDIDLFEVLAPQIASSIKKAQLYEKSLRFTEQLKVEVQKATQELQIANIKLQELDKAKSEFMSIASHQLRTPLTGLIGYLSMLSEGDYGKMTGQQTKVIHELLEAAHRLVRMVNIFLNVTRIEAGRFLLNITKVPMSLIIEDTIRELKPTAEKKGVELNYAPPSASLKPVYVDVDKVKDVALNLIDNAIKYTPQGKIWVTIEENARQKLIRVSVRDTGVGIDPKEAEKLFDKFVRGKGIARISPNGSGLGLFIAKKVVDAHEGKIWVESDGEGKGSTFIFEIPTKVRKTVEISKPNAKS